VALMYGGWIWKSSTLPLLICRFFKTRLIVPFRIEISASAAVDNLSGETCLATSFNTGKDPVSLTSIKT
jgi:hypothetical protein